MFARQLGNEIQGDATRICQRFVKITHQIGYELREVLCIQTVFVVL